MPSAYDGLANCPIRLMSGIKHLRSDQRLLLGENANVRDNCATKCATILSRFFDAHDTFKASRPPCYLPATPFLASFRVVSTRVLADHSFAAIERLSP